MISRSSSALSRSAIGLLTAGILSVYPLASAASQVPAAPGRMVEVGPGQRMHLYCTGSGSPAVILEAGAGAFSFVWALVQPAVSAVSRVCSYDRAGFAWSDPGALPRSTDQLSLELRTVLARAGERPPYVLVGHSFGGQLVRGYTDRYPDDVVGLVLVDAPHEDHRFQAGGELKSIRASATGQRAPTALIRPDPRQVALRTARTSSQRNDTSLASPLDQLPAPAQAWWKWAQVDSAFRISWSEEMAWSPEEMQRLFLARSEKQHPMGDRPLVVVARSYPALITDSLAAERRRQQLDLAHLSERGEVRFARNSGHNVEIEEPETIIRAIRDVIAMARRR